MTAEELANDIVNDDLENRIMEAATGEGFTGEQLRVSIELLRTAIRLAINQAYENGQRSIRETSETFIGIRR